MAQHNTARLLVLGVLATLVAATAVPLWLWSQGQTIPAGLHVTLTSLWGAGGVLIGLLAACVIYRLGQRQGDAPRLGQYTLLEKIGEGGMGAVYRASHALLRRPTAVKLLPAGKAGAERIQRFEREVQITSQLTHPNTVAIFDYGRTPDGVFYYAMEYLEGLTLEELVRVDGPQHPGRVALILRQIAASLAEAHALSIVHRDIKPSNIILVPERGGEPDVVKVVDFGLVKELDDDAAAAITVAGRIAGTPHYLSPEAISSPDRVGPHSDIYALGCVGYFLVTGQRVFEGRTAVEVCGHHLNSLPVLPAERLGRPVPELLSSVIMSCLQKDPTRRPTARGLISLLDGGLDLPSWTSEIAREWWSRQDLGAIKAARQTPLADEPESKTRSISTTHTGPSRAVA